ncbi:MAG: cytochrome c oxidase subunit 3, partial [Anaerolineae bacterium]|nr:cytochrome c oxidase subunit 3 [Anaerolineae bacterium]
AEEKRERERQRQEREAALRLKNNKLGVTIFQGSWIMVFVALIIVNWQMRYSPEWLKPGYSTPDATLPSVATALLLASAWSARSALRAVKADQVAQFLSQWRTATVLGGAFFLIMLSQLFALPPEAGQITSVFRVMIGYHAAHAIAIAFMMVQVMRYAQARPKHYNANNHWAVEATVRLWYFVVVAWIMFYVVLYWIP